MKKWNRSRHERAISAVLNQCPLDIEVSESPAGGSARHSSGPACQGTKAGLFYADIVQLLLEELDKPLSDRHMIELTYEFNLLST